MTEQPLDVEKLKSQLPPLGFWSSPVEKIIHPLIAEVERQRIEIRELRTLAKIGTWHNDCRMNRKQAAQELEKSQAVINKLADTVSQLEARLRALQTPEK